MDELYKQEILELTELLREDEEWEDLRNILVKNGFDLNQLLLVSFVEDEEENEFGVIVTKDLKAIEYSRSTSDDEENTDSFNSKEIISGMDKYPQISVAIDMINNGEVL